MKTERENIPRNSVEEPKIEVRIIFWKLAISEISHIEDLLLN